ncbi:HEAT repeat domain-containing protein, partial [Streptomyces sp. T-3]|nr:HEAT repeat domain-containing protein [Streptomyces sp. T-3]
AVSAASAIRPLLGHADAHTRQEAAAALWPVARDAEAVVPVLREGLASDRGWWWERTLDTVGALGPWAGPLLRPLRELLQDPLRAGAAGAAFWKAGGDAELAVSVLIREWDARPGGRPLAAACFLEMGDAARPALPLIRAELASSRRHNNSGSGGNMRYRVAEDEALLRDCRRLVRAL